VCTGHVQRSHATPLWKRDCAVSTPHCQCHSSRSHIPVIHSGFIVQPVLHSGIRKVSLSSLSFIQVLESVPSSMKYIDIFGVPSFRRLVKHAILSTAGPFHAISVGLARTTCIYYIRSYVLGWPEPHALIIYGHIRCIYTVIYGVYIRFCQSYVCAMQADTVHVQDQRCRPAHAPSTCTSAQKPKSPGSKTG